LHERQRELAARLQDSMNTIRLQQSLLEAPAAAARSIFVDQRA
jgi:hypothetical protein